MPAYDIINVEGIPVAFIGVVTQSAAGMVMPDGIKDIEFTDEIQAVNDAAEELKKKASGPLQCSHICLPNKMAVQ